MDKDSRNAVKPDFIVDDDSYLVEKYGGVFVTPYRVPDLLDKELQKVIAFLGQEISWAYLVTFKGFPVRCLWK